MENAEKTTLDNTGLNLYVALAYGARWDILNAKVGDSLKLNVSKIFRDENELHKITGIEEEKLNEVDEIDFKINELNKNEKAETNNDFFKKVYPNETIKSLNEFKNKIKEDIEKQFVNQSDQKFLNDVTDSFIKETKIFHKTHH